MILGIDTSGENLGLAVGERSVIRSSSLTRPGLKHGEIIQNEIADFLQSCDMSITDLSGIAIISGPGSFTGLRIGMAAAKGYCYAANLPLAGVSSLHAKALMSEITDGRILVVIDAKKDEFYFAEFSCSKGSVIRISNDSLIAKENISKYVHKATIVLGPAQLQSWFEANFTDITYRPDNEINLGEAACLIGAQEIAEGRQLDLSIAVPEYVRSGF